MPELGTFEGVYCSLRIQLRRLGVDERVEDRDLYLSSSGSWEDVPAPCVGLLVSELMPAVEYGRRVPEIDNHEPPSLNSTPDLSAETP